jgi:transposase
MRTPAARAELAREPLPYATCLSDAGWAVLDGILYVLRTGCAWRHLPLDFPPLRAPRKLWQFLAHCFAERTYRGGRVGTATALTVEIVEPGDGQTGFAVH